MGLAKNMEDMVKNNRLVISGKQGEDFLNYFSDTIGLVNMKE